MKTLIKAKWLIRRALVIVAIPTQLGLTAHETVENPLRAKIAQSDPDKAFDLYQEIVQAGSEIYFTNCSYCHGLPKKGTPWKSAQSKWHEMLSKEEMWQVLTFIDDYVGDVPTDQVQSQRTKMTGEEIYQFRCAVCHGEEGAGDGAAADFFYPKPRDFTMGTFKYKTSPSELPPRDEDLFNTIKNGLNGTSMPAWGNLLSDDQIDSLIPVIKGLDSFGTWETEEAEEMEQKPTHFLCITECEPILGQIPYSAESIAKGKVAFEKHCDHCHGEAGRGNIISARPLADDWGYRIWPRDLTKPWTWRTTNDENSRNETICNIYRLMSIGIVGTPMPAHRSTSVDPDPISLAERWHIANYVYSLRENSILPSDSSVIKGVRIEGALPISVDDPAWNQATATTLRLLPNIFKEDRLFTPLANAITVRVLYNVREIAFLLEVNDRTDSRPGEPVCEHLQDEFLELYSDAFAIQFPTDGLKKPLYRHGNATIPTTIWYWNAGHFEPYVAPRSMIFDGQCYDDPPSPRQGDKSLVATGQWENGRWRVLMKLARKGDDQLIPISFANWDGSNEEVGSRHTFTRWYWLQINRSDKPGTDWCLLN